VGIVVDGVEEDERFGDFPGELGFPVDGRQELEGGIEDLVIVATRYLSAGCRGPAGSRAAQAVAEDECLGVADVDQADVAVDCAGAR
jgi:hypothetical protein